MTNGLLGKAAHLIVFAALAGCSPQSGAQVQNDASTDVSKVAPSQHPISGLEVVPLTVETRAGTHNFRVEVARTFEQQRQGMMERAPLGDFEGMIFPYSTPGVRSYWMRNTPNPLDIIFIGPDERILNIHANAEPLTDTPRPSAGPANLVLEIRGGRAAELGIEPGDRVTW